MLYDCPRPQVSQCLIHQKYMGLVSTAQVVQTALDKGKHDKTGQCPSVQLRYLLLGMNLAAGDGS